jgi:hypothetical protein
LVNKKQMSSLNWKLEKATKARDSVLGEITLPACAAGWASGQTTHVPFDHELLLLHALTT